MKTTIVAAQRIRSSPRQLALAFLSLCAVILLTNCGPNMRNQAKCQPLEASSFFADGKCARDLPANTVPRGFLEADAAQTATGTDSGPTAAAGAAAPTSGAAAGPTAAAGAPTAAAGGAAASQAAQDFPFPVTREVLTTGHLSYNTFCSPCHGLVGGGDGMIVQRGLSAPPSFHTDRLRQVAPGYIYGVITNGFGRMYSYASRVEPDERWAIVAYIRALQLSQNATVDDVPADQRQSLEKAP